MHQGLDRKLPPVYSKPTMATTQTSLSLLEKYTWTSALAPPMDVNEYVFLLSSLQSHVDMARICNDLERAEQLVKATTPVGGTDASSSSPPPALSRRPSSPSSLISPSTSSSSLFSSTSPTAYLNYTLTLSCMNRYEIKRACQVWKSAIVHVDPDCQALQSSLVFHFEQSQIWTGFQSILWGFTLAVVGLSRQKIVEKSFKINSTSLSVMGVLLAFGCIQKTSKTMMAIPRGYNIVTIKNDDDHLEEGSRRIHLFLVRRDYAKKLNKKEVIPMYLLSALGIGSLVMGAKLAFAIHRSRR